MRVRKLIPSYYSDLTRPAFDTYQQPLFVEALNVFMQSLGISLSTLFFATPRPLVITCWKAFHPGITLPGPCPRPIYNANLDSGPEPSPQVSEWTEALGPGLPLAL